jgi:hypothetical protein
MGGNACVCDRLLHVCGLLTCVAVIGVVLYVRPFDTLVLVAPYNGARYAHTHTHTAYLHDLESTTWTY